MDNLKDYIMKNKNVINEYTNMNPLDVEFDFLNEDLMTDFNDDIDEEEQEYLISLGYS